ncbi:hypothetical protein AK812_SmicGene2122 [Symbiodinium microadriaticum]|uniref:Uncharacterized protein n=1 Tax=Symbiodinium microadriaticum TaxID=2951 RepID=A0A1Q9F267_SYMMI|nr:hypothetical protein AK812_SmicGene2122 [Symbiodinium microadriaticum]CAE7876130.1 unnamed protein product [Symbiodinium microadriaticum]
MALLMIPEAAVFACWLMFHLEKVAQLEGPPKLFVGGQHHRGKVHQFPSPELRELVSATLREVKVFGTELLLGIVPLTPQSQPRSPELLVPTVRTMGGALPKACTLAMHDDAFTGARPTSFSEHLCATGFAFHAAAPVTRHPFDWSSIEPCLRYHGLRSPFPRALQPSELRWKRSDGTLPLQSAEGAEDLANKGRCLCSQDIADRYQLPPGLFSVRDVQELMQDLQKPAARRQRALGRIHLPHALSKRSLLQVRRHAPKDCIAAVSRRSGIAAPGTVNVARTAR